MAEYAMLALQKLKMRDDIHVEGPAIKSAGDRRIPTKKGAFKKNWHCKAMRKAYLRIKGCHAFESRSCAN